MKRIFPEGNEKLVKMLNSKEGNWEQRGTGRREVCLALLYCLTSF